MKTVNALEQNDFACPRRLVSARDPELRPDREKRRHNDAMRGASLRAYLSIDWFELRISLARFAQDAKLAKVVGPEKP